MKNLIVLCCVAVFALGCSSTQYTVDPVKEKELKEMIDTKNFTVLMNTASPLNTLEINQLSALLPNGSTPNRIILTGGQDFFKMDGDIIKADLPYFGTRQLGGEYNYKKGGIIFDGAYKSYKIDYDEAKKIYKLRYRILHNRESFNVVVKIFANWKAEVYVNTSHRTAINYNGYVSKTANETVVTN